MEANAAKFVPPAFPEAFASTTAPRYIAEARFLRGISYYYLLQLYSRPYVDGNGSRPGVPLRLKGEKGFDGNDLARSTVAEVYDQILADLNFAEANLLADNAASGTYLPASNVTRAHRNAAIAFKTRVYLTMGRWNDVITEANKIVSANAPFTATSGVPHALAANIASVFAPPQSTTESIFSFPFSTLDPPGTQNQLGYYYLPPVAGQGNGEYFLNPNGIIANTGWKTTDARRSFITTSGANRYLTKYPTGTPYTDNSPVIRYAEVLLNLAEAITRSTNSVDARAVALLNAVRGRSDATTQFTAGSFATSNDLISALLLERRIEFLGEGLRSIDLMRLNMPIPGKGTISAVNPSDPNYVWPMPSTELNVNTLLERN
jgi:starch-binding outer membrane protein, SusD/RagB family